MMFRISVEQPADHPLILGIVLMRLAFEELHAALAQGDRDLDPFIPEHEVLRARQEVRNDLWVSERLVRVPDKPCLRHRRRLAQVWPFSHIYVWRSCGN